MDVSPGFYVWETNDTVKYELFSWPDRISTEENIPYSYWLVNQLNARLEISIVKRIHHAVI